MLKPQQIAALFDYCKYFRMQTQRVINEAENSRRIDDNLREAILAEQRRRLKELTRLEKALGDELDILNEEQPQGVKKDAKKIKQTKAARTKADEGTKPKAAGRTTRRNGKGRGMVPLQPPAARRTRTAGKRAAAAEEHTEARTNNDIPAADNHKPPAARRRRVNNNAGNQQKNRPGQHEQGTKGS